ncbi:MAG TPA: MFS transporter [Jiangellaceae bacterium]|nr:MFS transporter [Jiangellaceae bacterium]
MRSPVDIELIQRRTVHTLIGTQVMSGLGVSSGVSVAVLLASNVLGRPDLAGFVQSAQVLGSALLALPAAALAVRFGRRVGLSLALSLAAAGGLLAIAGAQLKFFPFLMLGMALYGGGTTAGLQSRYAAIDLAAPERRGRTLSVVVWSTTIGAVVGPNLVGPAGRVGEAVGIEPLAGPLLFGAVALVLAAALVWFRLRPDPLLLARRLEDVPAAAGEVPRRARRRRGGLHAGLRAVQGSPRAMLGMAAVVLAHTVMVSVMVMTPIHMDHGHASLTVIGLVISIHVAGMFAFSPVMGWLADRVGRLPVIALGGIVLLVSVALAGTAPEGHSAGLTAGLFLLGLGWSACLVAGSTLLSESVALEERPVVQGSSDLLMGLAAAGGGAVAGLVVGRLGYGVLNAGASVLAAAILAGVAVTASRASRVRRVAA